MREYCRTWFAHNAKADGWLSKISISRKIDERNKVYYYVIDGLPCWKATNEGANGRSIETMLTSFRNGCWYGSCFPFSLMLTAILQERSKGGYNVIDGLSLKAVLITTLLHAQVEVYIKGVGYYLLDNSRHYQLIPLTGGFQPNLVGMGNRHFCGAAGSGSWGFGFVSYNSTWAGPRITHPPVTPPPVTPPPVTPPVVTKATTFKSEPREATVTVKAKAVGAPSEEERPPGGGLPR